MARDRDAAVGLALLDDVAGGDVQLPGQFMNANTARRAAALTSSSTAWATAAADAVAAFFLRRLARLCEGRDSSAGSSATAAFSAGAVGACGTICCRLNVRRQDDLFPCHKSILRRIDTYSMAHELTVVSTRPPYRH